MFKEEKGFSFIKQKFNNIQNKDEVVKANERNKVRNNKKQVQKPEEKIEIYLNRFQEILDRETEEEKEKGVNAFKKIIFKDLIINGEDIPERVYQLEQKIAFNQGHGVVEITEHFKKEKQKEIINKQKESLSQWVDYLSSEDAMYPMWAKYWTFNSVTKLGNYNKEKGYFDKRGKNSVAPFPTLNPMAIAKAIETIQDKINNEEIENFSNKNDIEFQKILNKEDFGRLYALALESMPEFSEKGLENINGEWVVYEQGSDAQELFDSLQGYPLEWCTAGSIGTAQGQLDGGDFYVYYSEDEKGKNKIPRVAIRTEGEHIAEVRGIEKGQNLDNFITPVVKEKMEEFGEEGEQYEKKVDDMEILKNIYNKTFKIIDLEKGEKEYLNPEFSEEEMLFIYEFNGQIEGFGYQRDPRISEIIEARRNSGDLEKLKDIFLNSNNENGGEIFIEKMLTSSNESFITDNIEEYVNIDCGRFNEQIIKTKEILDIVDGGDELNANELFKIYFADFDRTLWGDEYDEYDNVIGNSADDFLENFLKNRDVLNDFSEMIDEVDNNKLIDFIEEVEDYRVGYYCNNPYHKYLGDLIELVIEKISSNDEYDYMDIEDDLNKGIPFSRSKRQNLNKKDVRDSVYSELAEKNICQDAINKYVEDFPEDEMLPVNIINTIMKKSSEYYLCDSAIDKIIENYNKLDSNLLNRDFAELLLKKNNGKNKILDNIDKFVKGDQENIINNILIKRFTFNDIEIFKEFKSKVNLDEREILKQFFERDTYELRTAENLDILDVFEAYPVEILNSNQWCGGKCADKVFENWEKFEGVEVEVAEHLLKHGYEWEVVKNIDKFANKINIAGVEKLFDYGEGEFIIGNYEKYFSNIEFKYILEIFYRIDDEKKDSIFDMWTNNQRLFDVIKKYANEIDQGKLFFEIKKTGYLRSLVENIDYFDEIDKNILVNTIIEKAEEGVVRRKTGIREIMMDYNIENFSDTITQRQLEKIIELSDSPKWGGYGLRFDSLVNFNKLKAKDAFDIKNIAKQFYNKMPIGTARMIEKNYNYFIDKVGADNDFPDVTEDDLKEWTREVIKEEIKKREEEMKDCEWDCDKGWYQRRILEYEEFKQKLS